MPKADAIEFLQAALAAGPVPATEVGRMAGEHGLTSTALRTAREGLGVRITRKGFGRDSRSLWSLPMPPQETEEDRCTRIWGGTVTLLTVGLEPDKPCNYCCKHAGPRGPQSGAVYRVRNPFSGRLEPLHGDCATFWLDWLSKIPSDIRARMLNGAG
jgi:hypothetical protein